MKFIVALSIVFLMVLSESSLSQDNSSNINIVLRYDDYSAISDSNVDVGILEILDSLNGKPILEKGHIYKS